MLETPEGVDDAVARAVGEKLAEAMAIAQKQVRGAAVEKVRNKAVAALADEYAVRATERDESPNEAQTSERIRPAFFFSRSRTHRRAPVASHSMRPRAAGPTAEGAEPSWGASNARSAHLGVAPEHFRVRRFARAAHPSERSVDFSLFPVSSRRERVRPVPSARVGPRKVSSSRVERASR